MRNPTLAELERFAVGCFLTDGGGLYEVIGSRGEIFVRPGVTIPHEILVENSQTLESEWVDPEVIMAMTQVRTAAA